MIIYSAHLGGDARYFATLREAITEARQYLAADAEDGELVEINRHQVVPLTKANFVHILNWDGGQWSTESTVVKTLRAKEAGK
jgi:hypothetical protein